MSRNAAGMALVLSVAFCAGCQLPTLPLHRSNLSRWSITVDGDPFAAIRGFERAAADFGAKSLGEPTENGATYRVGEFTFGVWPAEKGLDVVAGAIDPESKVDTDVALALYKITTLASRTGPTAFRLQRRFGSTNAMIARPPDAPPPNTVPGSDDYDRRLWEKVNVRLDALISHSPDYPYIGSFVRVTFVLTADGQVNRIVNVETHGSDLPAKLAVRAVTESAPFPKWPASMAAALGSTSQELTYTFVFE